MPPSIRYRGPLKVVEHTGQWGVYLGERVVCGDGRAVDDDLGVKIRNAIDAAQVESIELDDVEITIKIHKRPRSRRR